MFNVIKFYQDNHISISKSIKHSRPGWVNIDCPFCRGSDGHLGVHLNTGAVKCWKCGPHSQLNVIKAILNCEYETAKEVLIEYSTGERNTRHVRNGARLPTRAKVITCPLPEGAGELTNRHRAYLEGRNYDSFVLEKIWGLCGTNHIGPYKFRILAPIIFNGVMVSYQGRDITGKSELKYKACKQENEIIEHQTIVYGYDLVKGNACVVVEGIADCWRLGPGAICCFGISFTTAQINLIASRFKTVYILFDAEEEAQKQARVLAAMLSSNGVEVEILELESGDPGEMSQQEANKLMEELL